MVGHSPDLKVERLRARDVEIREPSQKEMLSKMPKLPTASSLALLAKFKRSLTTSLMCGCQFDGLEFKFLVWQVQVGLVDSCQKLAKCRYWIWRTDTCSGFSDCVSGLIQSRLQLQLSAARQTCQRKRCQGLAFLPLKCALLDGGSGSKNKCAALEHYRHSRLRAGRSVVLACVLL